MTETETLTVALKTATDALEEACTALSERDENHHLLARPDWSKDGPGLWTVLAGLRNQFNPELIPTHGINSPYPYGRPLRPPRGPEKWVYPPFKIRGDNLENAADEALGDFVDTMAIVLQQRAKLIEKVAELEAKLISTNG